jgi:hypothetical protein
MRCPDIYSPISRTAIEGKNGHVAVNRFVREEVSKDAALVADPGTLIDSVVWHSLRRRAKASYRTTNCVSCSRVAVSPTSFTCHEDPL